MNHSFRLLVFLLFLPFHLLYGQVEIVSYLPPTESLTVCVDSTEIAFSIRANGVAANNITLDIQMPAGLDYAPNTLRKTNPGSKNLAFSSFNNHLLSLTADDLGPTDSLTFAFQFTAIYYQNTLTSSYYRVSKSTCVSVL